MAAWCALMCHKNLVRNVTRLFIEVSSQGSSLICKNKRLEDEMNICLWDSMLPSLERLVGDVVSKN